MNRVTWVALAVLFAGCEDDPGSMADLEKKKANPQPVVPKENVKMLSSPVQPGKHVPCTQILDQAKVSEKFGRPLEVKEDKMFDADAVASCAVHTTGKALTEKEQKKIFDEQAMRLGVQPGDELCRATLYCWAPYPEVASAKKDCESRGETTSSEIGDLTCVKEFEAGDRYKHVYSVFDPDSKCRLQVNPGPSVTEEEVVKLCARIFSEIIGPEQIKVL